MSLDRHDKFIRLVAQIIEAKGTPLADLASHYRAGPELLAKVRVKELVGADKKQEPVSAPQAKVRKTGTSISPRPRPRTPVLAATDPNAPQSIIPPGAPTPILESEISRTLPDYWQKMMSMQIGQFDRLCERIGLQALAIAMRSVKVEEVTAAAAPLGLKPARKLLELISHTTVAWPPEARRGMRSVYSHLLSVRKPDDVLRSVGVAVLTTLYNVMDASLRRRITSPRIRAVLDAHPMSACKLPQWPSLAEAVVVSCVEKPE